MGARLKEIQESLGLCLKDDWLTAFATSLPAGCTTQQQRDHLLARYLCEDLHSSGAGCLPADLQVTVRTL